MNNFAPVVIDASRKKSVAVRGFGILSLDSWQQFINDTPSLNKESISIKNFTFLSGGSSIIIIGKVKVRLV